MSETEKNHQMVSQQQKNQESLTKDQQQQPLFETVCQQVALISVLKNQIQKLQNEVIIAEINCKQKDKLYHEALYQIETQKEKIDTLKENNDSIIHTFEVFQREFVKRDYKNGINILIHTENDKNTKSDGPLFLQLIRNMKTKFSQFSNQQPQKGEQSQLNEYYGYFFNEVADDSGSELYNQVSQYKQSTKLIMNKIKLHGRKKYFQQKHRSYFWYNIIDRPLKITYKLYEKYLQQCNSNRQNLPQDSNTLIDRDLNRMDFKLDDEKGKLMKSTIKNCLQIFQLYRPDIGYVQGMSYLAWMLLMRMDDFQGFSCFSNLIICDSFVHSLYTFKEQQIRKLKTFFEKCMEDKRSKIYKHMKNLEVDSQLFIIEWAYTMFTRAFNLRISSKIWDLWFCEGYNTFFKVVLVIMDMLQQQILLMNQNDKIVQLLRTQTHKLDELEFLRLLKKQKLPQQLEL